METKQSNRHSMRGNEMTSFGCRVRYIAVLAVSVFLLIVHYVPNAAAAPPDWLRKQLQGAAKKQKSTTECVADSTLADEWLNESNTTKSYKIRTIDLLTNWDTKMPLDRFLLPNATPKEEKQAMEARNNAKKEFKQFADKLFDMAQTVAIERSRKCQDCILINYWSYLAYISVKGVKEYNLGAISTDGELTHPLPVAGTQATKIKLETVTDEGVRLVRPLISKFKERAAIYDAAHEDKEYSNIAPGVCTPLSLDPAADFDACWNAMTSKCLANDFAQAKTYCLKSMVDPTLKKSLGDIVDTLSTRAATSGTVMKSFDHTLCKPRNSGYFSSIRFRNFAVGF